MISRLLFLFCLVALSGCASLGSVEAVKFSGASHHVSPENVRNEFNPGLSLEFRSDFVLDDFWRISVPQRVEVGAYRNSRVHESYSVFALNSFDVMGLQVGAGAAVYDSRGSYPLSVKPIAFVGKRLGFLGRSFVDLRYYPLDLFSLQLGFRL